MPELDVILTDIMDEEADLNSADDRNTTDGVRRRPTISRKSRLRGSHRRMRHRGNAVEDQQQQQRRRQEEELLAQDIVQDIVQRRTAVGRGKALLTGPQGLDTIRESGLSLNEKRNILLAVKAEEGRSRRDTGARVVECSCCTMCQASIAMKMQHLRYRFFDLIYGINFWEGSIKAVEGLFGTGVGSYFRFLKWLFLLNIPIFLVCFSFVTIPQLVFDYSNATVDDVCPRTDFDGWELLTGKGNFSCSPLYYGHYTNKTINVVGGLEYEMPLFYFLSICIYFLINLAVIAVRISSSYRVNFIEGSGDFKFYFVNKVFAGWDFGVVDPTAAALKNKSLRQEIGEYISLIHTRTIGRKRNKGFALQVLQHIAINGVVIAMLVGCGYVMFLLLNNPDPEYEEKLENFKEKVGKFGGIMTPLVVTVMVFFIPKIFSLMTLVEKYELPQRSLYMTLFRTVCLYGVVLGNLLYYWGTSLNRKKSKQEEHQRCWENDMGQDIYGLVILDFIMTILDFFFTDFLRSVTVKLVMIKILKRDPESVQGYLPNFNVALNTLNLIYSQSLAWFGIFYSPLLPVVQLIKLILVFYLKKVTVLKNCAPFKRAWRGARVQTIFLILLFLGFMTALVLLACGIYLATPSATCGPYRGKEKVHDALMEFISDFYGNASWLGTLVEFLTSSWFIILVVVFLSIKVYYARVSAIAKLETITMLKRQLQLSSFDKKFLLRQIQENSQGGHLKGRYPEEEREVVNPYGCPRGSAAQKEVQQRRSRSQFSDDGRRRSMNSTGENNEMVEMHRF